MKVHLKQIPAEGIHLEGKEETDILELEENQIRPVGTCRYSLDIGVSESGSVRHGKISAWMSAWSASVASSGSSSRFAFETLRLKSS